MSQENPQDQAEQLSRREKRRRQRAERQIEELERRLDVEHTRFLDAQSQLRTASIQSQRQREHIESLEAKVVELTDRLSLMEGSKSIIVTGSAVVFFDMVCSFSLLKSRTPSRLFLNWVFSYP